MTAGPRAAAAYVAPFAAYVALMAVEPHLGIPVQYAYPLRVAIVSLILAFCSQHVIPWHPSFLLRSTAVGVLVFFLWIAPDVLFGPGWRHSPLFENLLTGHAASSIPAAAQRAPLFLAIRVLRSVILVPIVEELFWRGWLMRWLIRTDFLSIPIGRYAPAAFWIVVILFASEHGPFWDVGLIAGVVYNCWVIRTRNLADAILAHAVTNAVLAGYVLWYGRWQYWL